MEEWPRKRAVKKRDIVTPDMVASLDRVKISDRGAMRVISATVSALDEDIDTLSLSRSTLRRKRMALRKQIADDVKKTFQAEVPLTVHWDGKLMPDLLDSDNIDRLPVVVSGLGKYKLLGVPKLSSSTGEEMAKAVYECLNDWNLEQKIIGMCFDF